MGRFFIPAISLRVKQLWDVWNIRGAILFSLFLQTILIFVAPIRKSARKSIVILLIWFAYLMADAAANFAVGLISNSQRNQSNKSDHHSNPKEVKESSDLLAFWAPFLLLHLGGPDTITAFALEDNELWLRHLLGLVFQAAAVIYVFIQSLPNDNLWIPTVLMFTAGIIKYVERTRALFLASLDRFRDSMLKNPDPGPNYAKLMEEYASKKDAKLPTSINMTPEPDKETKASDVTPKEGDLNDLEVVHYAYRYFNTFKGLVVDLIFSFRERDESRDFFYRRSAIDALRIIEVELNFLYGALYTKLEVVHWVGGYIFRFLAFASVLATLGIFYYRTNKREFAGVEIGITYTLLLGAIALDVVSFLMLIFSDRTFASIKNPERPGKYVSPVAAIFKKFLALKKPRWHPCTCKMNKSVSETEEIKAKHHVLVTPLAFRRWSGAVSAHNLIRYCLKSKRTTIHKFIGLCGIICEKILGCLKIVLGCLKIETVFEHCRLLCRSKNVTKKADESPKGIDSICSTISRVNKFSSNIGEKVTQCFNPVFDFIKKYCVFDFIKKPFKDYWDEFWYVSVEPFTRELWEFIFEELKGKSEFADNPETAKRISTARGEWVLTDTSTHEDRSKLLEYVSGVPYDESLLLWHIATDLCFYSDEEFSSMESADEEFSPAQRALTYREFSKILSDYMLYLLVFQPTMMSAVAGIGKIRFRDTCAEAKRFFARRSLQPNKDKDACKQILSVNTDVEPVSVKGDRSKSVLFDASILAKELKKMEAEVKWKLISRVWVELVSYAASHCTASTHANQVSKGGELITFFWLLMAHFGLGEQFQINEGHARAKLIVGK